jgi:hypothetical protein
MTIYWSCQRDLDANLDVSVDDVLDKHVDESLNVVNEVIRKPHLAWSTQPVALGQMFTHSFHLLRKKNKSFSLLSRRQVMQG